MSRRRLRLAVIAAAGLAASGCDFWFNTVPSPDDLWYSVPWFDHMIHARYVRPYETAKVPRNSVPGTVPVSGTEADWLAEWTAGKTATADRLVNPTRTGNGRISAPGPDVPLLPGSFDARGDSLFQTFCAVCHGGTGAANGPVSPKIGAPSLLTQRARSYTDGYIYSIIRYGRGVMPRYGDKVYLPAERWAIVNHVRQLQARAPAEPTPAAPVAPTKPNTRAAPKPTPTGASR